MGLHLCVSKDVKAYASGINVAALRFLYIHFASFGRKVQVSA